MSPEELLRVLSEECIALDERIAALKPGAGVIGVIAVLPDQQVQCLFAENVPWETIVELLLSAARQVRVENEAD
jgi:hypothetical protein